MARTHLQSNPRALIVVLLVSASALLTGCDSGSKSSSASSNATAAPKGSYAFWPQFPADPRIQFVRAIASSDDISGQTQSGFDQMVFGKKAGDSEAINKPYGAAIHEGKIYVCDIRNACLTVLDLHKKQTRLVGVSGLMTLKRPVAVVVADDGMIYVADNDRGSIFVFDAQERYVSVMGHEKLKPAGLAVHGDRLYVTDLTSQSVEWFDRRTGARQGGFGTVGDEDGQFRLPLGIAVDTKGDVYVVDMMRCRIQKFSPDGKFISGFGSLGDFAGAFVRPKHVAVDADGNIYVVDAAFQNVQMFDSQFRLLMHFGSAGAFPGSMNLPAGICVSEADLDLVSGGVHPGFKPKCLVIVTNQFGNAPISLYAMGGLREGFTAKDLAAASVQVPSGMGEGAKNILQSPVPGTEVAPAPGEGPRPGAPGSTPAPSASKAPQPSAAAAPTTTAPAKPQ